MIVFSDHTVAPAVKFLTEVAINKTDPLQNINTLCICLGMEVYGIVLNSLNKE